MPVNTCFKDILIVNCSYNNIDKIRKSGVKNQMLHEIPTPISKCNRDDRYQTQRRSYLKGKLFICSNVHTVGKQNVYQVFLRV